MRVKKLKIVHIAPFYYPVIGGMEELVQNISENLADRGHEVDVFTSYVGHDGKRIDRPTNEIIKGVNVHRFRTIFKHGFITLFPGIIPKLIQTRFDIIHLHSFRHPHTEIGSILGRIRSIPTILHGHSPFYSTGFKSLFYSLYDSLSKYFVFRNVTEIIAVTEPEKKEYIKRGADFNKIIVIPNAISNVYFKKGQIDVFIDKYNLRDKKIVLFMGRLHSDKRVDILIKSFAMVLKQEPKAFLLLVGPDGGAYHALKQIITNLGIEDHCKWLGSITDLNEKINIYTSASCFVLPSDYEAFGIVILEAMAAGKPVIAANAGGPSEIIDENKTGFLFKRGDIDDLKVKIIKILSDDVLAKKMGENAAVKAEDFILPRIVDVIENLYYSLHLKKQKYKI
jgi:glycosyltransferase involved in cell wall biosynthesis